MTTVINFLKVDTEHTFLHTFCIGVLIYISSIKKNSANDR